MSDKGDTNPVEDAAEITEGDQTVAIQQLKGELQVKDEKIRKLEVEVTEKDAKIVK